MCVIVFPDTARMPYGTSESPEYECCPYLKYHRVILATSWLLVAPPLQILSSRFEISKNFAAAIAIALLMCIKV